MALTDRASPGSPRSLAGACAAHGIPLENAHSAREDALAAASLLRAQLGLLEPADFAELGVAVLHLPAAWPEVAASGRAHPRSQPAPRGQVDRPGWDSAGEAAYAEALHWAIEDGEIDSIEVDHLLGVARNWSLEASVVASTSERILGDLELSPDVRHRLGVVERALRSVG